MEDQQQQQQQQTQQESLDSSSLPMLFGKRNDKLDAKFAIAIHCDHCHQFGILSPAVPYRHDTTTIPTLTTAATTRVSRFYLER